MLKTASEAQVYDVWVKDSADRSSSLIMHQIDSNEITVSSSIMFDKANAKRYPIQNVEYIMVRRRGAPATGVVVGTISGALVGYLIGKSVQTPEDKCGCSNPNAPCIDLLCGLQPALGALLGGATGLIVGVSIGTKRKKIPFNGRYNAISEKYVYQPKEVKVRR